RNVGVCLRRLGRNQEALPKLEASLEMYQRIHKGDHFNVAQALNNVAVCLDVLGRSADAVSRYEQALAMRRRLLESNRTGSEDLFSIADVAESLYNLSACLGDLGHVQPALTNCQEALNLRQHLADAQPGNTAAKLELARTHRKVGEL